MKRIKAKPRQTVFDIALEQYGTADAVEEILRNNSVLVNDPAALIALGIEAIGQTDFYPDIALAPGSVVLIDGNSLLRQPNTLKELTDDITTFDT